ncbi:MATE family efflux transporter [bacterium D16-51]|nr:MATE family efflux transporter [bacterium D16-59]RKI60799.1 MATE family efflux transporter [bacterium D16-51]
MAKSMTEGSSVKLILQFALPLLIGNLLQQTYNIIDAAIVGKVLGTDALASVGASSSVQFLVLGFCIGICCGFGIPVAKSFGAGDYGQMRKYIFHAIFLTGVFAVVLTVACALLCPQILNILTTPEDIYQGAYQYLLVIFLGIPFTLLYNLLSGILRAVGDSKTPFMFLALSTVLNIGLDLFCILVLKWGCAGAAIATVTAQAVSGILCFLYIYRRFQILRLSRQDCMVKGKFLKSLLLMGIPMGLQYSVTAIGSMVMQSANNGLGSVYVSGFTAAMRIKQFLMCPFDAIATAVSVFCGQNLGARKIERIKKGIREGVFLGVGYGVAAGVVLIFGGRVLSMLFVSRDSAEVLDASAKYLFCLGFFFWSLGILNVCRMTTQGLGYSGRTIFSGVAEMIARIFVSFVFVPLYGFNAICFADQAAWLSGCIYILPACLICIRKIEAQAKG